MYKQEAVEHAGLDGNNQCSIDRPAGYQIKVDAQINGLDYRGINKAQELERLCTLRLDESVIRNRR